MQLLQQLAFIIMTTIAIWFFSKQVGKVRRNIRLGKSATLKVAPGKRWKNVMLIALGQKKMFKYPVVALLHLVIYAGFIIINIEVLEIVLDGVFGTHRLFQPYMGKYYNWLINSFEFLAVGVLLTCVIFLIRRNILKIRRLNRKELEGWPKKDANYILLIEIGLMMLFLTMNAADNAILLQKGMQSNSFIISGGISSFFLDFDIQTNVIIERAAWWLHIAGILAFLNYLPFSKHFHIILSFPNVYYGGLDSMGKMKNMKVIQDEVVYAMQPELAPAESPDPERFGAKDITDLSWKNLMDAYSCTECGRCTAACPANITGKKLSPRKIMMDTRDRMEEIGEKLDRNGHFVEDGKALLHDYISVEELRACTTCQACVEECPVNINPLDIILQLRRYLIMEESNAPQEWTGMFSNVENNFAPWKFSPDQRANWATDMPG